MSGGAPAWLTSRPIAHRGLHNKLHGVVENSLQAAQAALAKNFAIECDVQSSADGEAMVFHDYTLERLTAMSGRIEDFSTRALSSINLRGTGEPIPTLLDLLAEIELRTPLICEIKSRFNGDMLLAERAAHCVAAYGGPVALKSFDPEIIAHLRANRSRLGIARVPLGMIAQANYDDKADEWAHLTHQQKHELAHFLHWSETQPDFLSWGVTDLPHAVPFLCRAALELPVMTWTVRTQEQAMTALEWADQIIFEGDVAT